jgi:DNA (cytosine-5)-methyltransferase 1
MIDFIELFAGIGGFRKGLEEAGGYNCVYANEWDKYAADIYKRNFHERPDTRDLRAIPVEDIPDHSLLVGGFPCQAFSVAGKRRGFEDTRGTLFFEIARILDYHRPPLLLLENVKGLLNHAGGETFRVILETLDGLGYDVQWQVLNSKDFGVPQYRNRVYIVGNHRRYRRPKVFPIRYNAETSLRELTSQSGQAYRVYGVDGLSPTLNTCGGGNRQPKILVDKLGVAIAYGQLKHKELATTLDANYYKGLDNHEARTGVLDGGRIRKLTPIECERLQGFPEGWTEGVSDTQRYKTLGNAVTVNVVREIGKRLL